MQYGFEIFEKIGAEYATYEVFPTASYNLFRDDTSAEITFRLGSLASGPKDMLDAYVAAVTLREFVQERGCEVGDGDGLGSIILPRPISTPIEIEAVMRWPDRDLK